MTRNLSLFACYLLLNLGSAVTWAAPGDLDTTFGTAGEVALAYGNATAIAPMPDGRLLMYDSTGLAGRQPQLRSRMLMASGQLDTRWGVAGESVINLSGAAYAQAQWDYGQLGFAGAANGSVTGLLSLGTNTRSATLARVIRLRSDGTLDTAYSDNTPANLLAGLNDIVYSDPWLQSDGRVLTLLGCNTCDAQIIPSQLQLLRTDGSVERVFDFLQSALLQSLGNIWDAHRLPDGRIVVAGDTGLLRFNADGSLDTTYGNQGAVRIQPDTATLTDAIARALGAQLVKDTLSIRGAVIGDDDTALLSMSVDNVGGTRTLVFLMRLDASGNPDPGFGSAGNGVVKIDLAGSAWETATSLEIHTSRVSTAANGNILVTLGFLANGANHLAVLRLDATGKLPANPALRSIQLLGVQPGNIEPFAPQNDGSLYLRTSRTVVRLSATAGSSAGLLVPASDTFTYEDVDGATSVVSIPITRIAGSSGRVGIDYATADSSNAQVTCVLCRATAGSDYVATSGRLEWADGETGTKYIQLTINNDTLTEPLEQLQIRLSNVTGSPLLAADAIAISIAPSDPVPAAPAPPPTPAPSPTPAPAVTPAASGSGGGGAFDLWSLLVIACCVLPSMSRRIAATVSKAAEIRHPPLVTKRCPVNHNLRQSACALALTLVAAAANAAPGDFDTTFANGGTLTLPYLGYTSATVAIDGRILAWEYSDATSNLPRFRVTRLLTNGQPDSSWGTGGEAVVDTSAFLAAQGKSQCSGKSAYGFSSAADGSAAGSLYFTCTGTDYNLLVKLRANGAIDTNFGQGGFVDLAKTVAPLFSYAMVSGPTADGGVLASMYGYDDYGDFLVAMQRLRADGSVAATVIGGPGYFAYGSRATTRLFGDGRIMAAGGSEIRRYSANGTADDTYGNAGKVDLTKTSALGMAIIAAAGLSRSSADLQIYDAVINADGSVVFALLGTMTSVNKVLMARVTPAGLLDTSFGSGGVAQLDTSAAPWAGRTLDAWRSLRLVASSTGELTLMGQIDTRTTSIALARFTYLWRLTASGQPPASATLRGLQILAEELNDYPAIGGLIGAQSGSDVLLAGAGYNTLFRLAGNAGASPGMLTITNFVAVNEGTVVQIPVVRSSGSNGALSVSYSTATINTLVAATAGSDYTAASGRLDWADGETGVKYIPITILADQQTEPSERFDVNITISPCDATSDVCASIVGTGKQVVIEIRDNSAPTTTSTPTPAPAPTTTTTSGGSSGGGGAFDLWSLLLLAGCALPFFRGVWLPQPPNLTSLLGC